MPRAELEFHVRDLPVATSDSLRPLLAFRRDLLEGSPVALELGLIAAQRLPALHDHVDVLGIPFHTAADTFGEFCGAQPGAAPQEGVLNQPAHAGVLPDRATAPIAGLRGGAGGRF